MQVLVSNNYIIVCHTWVFFIIIGQQWKKLIFTTVWKISYTGNGRLYFSNSMIIKPHNLKFKSKQLYDVKYHHHTKEYLWGILLQICHSWEITILLIQSISYFKPPSDRTHPMLNFFLREPKMQVTKWKILVIIMYLSFNWVEVKFEWLMVNPNENGAQLGNYFVPKFITVFVAKK